MTFDAEPILAAAWAVASADASWLTKSRNLLHWADVPASGRPALFQSLKSVSVRPLGRGVTALRELRLTYTIYTAHTGATVAQTTLVNAIAVLADTFAPLPGFETQRLGGLAYSAAIDGEIETDEGTLGTDAVAFVPVLLVVG